MLIFFLIFIFRFYKNFYGKNVSIMLIVVENIMRIIWLVLFVVLFEGGLFIV